MPFEICPACKLSTYSARLRLMIDDECPRCGAPLDRGSALRENETTKRMLGRCRGWMHTLGERPDSALPRPPEMRS